MSSLHLVVECSWVSYHPSIHPVCSRKVIEHLLTLAVAAVLILHLVEIQVVGFLVEGLLTSVYTGPVRIW